MAQEQEGLEQGLKNLLILSAVAKYPFRLKIQISDQMQLLALQSISRTRSSNNVVRRMRPL